MQLDVVFKEMQSSDAVQNRIEEKAKKIENFIAEDENVRVVVHADFKGHRHMAEISWHDNRIGKDFYAKAEGHDLYTQVDEVFDKISKQVHKLHDKLVNSKRRMEAPKKIPVGG